MRSGSQLRQQIGAREVSLAINPYFRFDRYFINTKAPKAKTIIARIDPSPIPSILQPPIIRSMLMRLSLRCAECQARDAPTAKLVTTSPRITSDMMTAC